MINLNLYTNPNPPVITPVEPTQDNQNIFPTKIPVDKMPKKELPTTNIDMTFFTMPFRRDSIELDVYGTE